MIDGGQRKGQRLGRMAKAGVPLMIACSLILCSCALLERQQETAAGSLERLSPDFVLGAVMNTNRDWLYPPGDSFACVDYRRVVSAETPEGEKILHEERVSYDRPFALSAAWRVRGVPFETTLEKDIRQQEDTVCEMERTPEGNLQLSLGVPVFPDDPKDLEFDFPFDRYFPVATLMVDPETLRILQIVGEDETLTCSDYLRVGPGRWVPRAIETSDGTLYRFQWSGGCLWFAQSVRYEAGRCPASGYYEGPRGIIRENYPEFLSWPVTITNDEVRINRSPKRWRLVQKADVDGDPEIEEVAMPFWYPRPTYIGAELQPGDVVAIRPHDFGTGERDYESNFGFGVRLSEDDERTGSMYIGLQQESGGVMSIPVIAMDPVAADECLPDGSLRRCYEVESGNLRFRLERQIRLIDSPAAPTGQLYEETLSLVNGKEALRVEYWAENLECDDQGSLEDPDGDGESDTLVCLNNNVAGTAPAIAKVYLAGALELPSELNQLGPMGRRLLTVRQSVDQTVAPRDTLVLSRAYYIVSNVKPPEDCMRQVLDCAKVLLTETR